MMKTLSPKSILPEPRSVIITKKLKHIKRKGFALIATIVVMSLISLTALAMLSISTVESRTSGVGNAQLEAQANARMALMLALGELQQAAGPDQRITATADILSEGTNAPAQGRSRWVGVWDTEDYDPSDPDTKPFVKWLVSSRENLTNEADAKSGTIAVDHRILTVNNGAGVDATNSVTVDKLPINNSAGIQTGAYAYWVEDEGVKASLGWNEGTFTDANRGQHARLTSSPGIDHGVFGGPLSNNIQYPLESGNSNLDKLSLANSVGDIPAAKESGSHSRDWVQQNRKHLTLNSKAVMADVKNGGLRRDLSLAFEMDGDSESYNAFLFNAQQGEFVGGSDKNASPYDCPGMPAKERYLFRETRSTNGPFASHVMNRTSHLSNRSASVSRGPTWWALRDYYNLYKKLKQNGSNFEMDARAYYPNRRISGGGNSYAFSTLIDTIHTWADARDADRRKPHQGTYTGEWAYLYRPAQSNYAPALLGTSIIVSLKTIPDGNSGRYKVVYVIDPVFYLWNPYNRKIKTDNLMVHLETGFPGTVTLDISGTAYNNGGIIYEKDADGNVKKNANGDPIVKTSHTYKTELWKLLTCNLSNYFSTGQSNTQSISGISYGFFIKSNSNGDTIVMEPGEVIAATATNTAGESHLGYNPLDNSSGVTLSSIDVSGFPFTFINPKDNYTGIDFTNQPIYLDNSSSINVGFNEAVNNSQNGGNTNRFFMDLSIPHTGITAADMGTWPRNVRHAMPGNQLQHMHMQLTQAKPHNIVENTRIFSTNKTANSLIDTKAHFGLFSYLMKPARWTGPVFRNTDIEQFTRFNPMPNIVNKDYWGSAPPSMLINFTSSENPNDLINNNGVNFSASSRRAFWGRSYASNGSTRVVMKHIPSKPLFSMAEFSDASISFMADDAFKAIGNSLSSPIIPAIAPFGQVETGGGNQTLVTGHDLSWNCNDALFDRYYLSGFASDYQISSRGYSATNSINDTLNLFYKSNYKTVNANPVLEPYIPAGKSADAIIEELTPNNTSYDGYKRVGAYSLIKGSFNVNSTSVEAWEAFLRANKDLNVNYAAGGTETSDGTPFPSTTQPSKADDGANEYWAGLSRLSDAQIRTLAEQIVVQVKKRAPFMSLSNFVNRKVGGNSITTEHHAGAIQAAIYDANINQSTLTSAGGRTFNYSGWLSPIVQTSEQNNINRGFRSTASGIPTTITQADILKPLAPRMNARSDTFIIRAYGESIDSNGNILASAWCEAVVQRTPEYIEHKEDPSSTAAGNLPWDDDAPNTTSGSKTGLTTQNKRYGRKFIVQQFRWINDNEI